jgi:hypothetical protein
VSEDLIDVSDGKKYWKADYFETDWPREPFERAGSSSDQIRACHAAVHMSPYDP